MADWYHWAVGIMWAVPLVELPILFLAFWVLRKKGLTWRDIPDVLNCAVGHIIKFARRIAGK